MKIWLDDLRSPPDDTWHWCTTTWCARGLLSLYGGEITEMSLDNDLGECHEEGRKLIRWMCETSRWPSGDITIHSANPVAGEYMRGMIDRYRP